MELYATINKNFVKDVRQEMYWIGSIENIQLATVTVMEGSRVVEIRLIKGENAIMDLWEKTPELLRAYFRRPNYEEFDPKKANKWLSGQHFDADIEADKRVSQSKIIDWFVKEQLKDPDSALSKMLHDKFGGITPDKQNLPEQEPGKSEV